ncbi:MAG: HD domain-containing protein [archaeon]|jgi:5'-deoxynucleotidase YfbR-like HD superfamily hydrolase
MTLKELVDFFTETNKLKYTMRYSSCPKKIQDSSAEHSWHLTVMIPLIAEELGLKINVLHAVEIALVHDLAEKTLKEDFDSFLVASGKLSETDKDKGELEEMNKLRKKYSFGEKIYSLWREYEDNKTPEAKFVKAMDKLEAHAHIIEKGTYGNNEAGAIHQVYYADKAVKDYPELKPLLSEMKKKLRPVLEKQGLKWKKEYDWPQ